MYKCVKFFKKIFLKINNFNIYLKLNWNFYKILPKLYIIKYINLYFKYKKNWKNIKLKIKNIVFLILKYIFFYIKFFKN